MEENPTMIKNDKVIFSNDSELGLEFIKIFLKEDKNGMQVQIVHKQGIEEILPKDYINYVMNNIGKFMVHSIKLLNQVNSETEQPTEKNSTDTL